MPPFCLRLLYPSPFQLHHQSAEALSGFQHLYCPYRKQDSKKAQSKLLCAFAIFRLFRVVVEYTGASIRADFQPLDVKFRLAVRIVVTGIILDDNLLMPNGKRNAPAKAHFTLRRGIVGEIKGVAHNIQIRRSALCCQARLPRHWHGRLHGRDKAWRCCSSSPIPLCKPL